MSSQTAGPVVGPGPADAQHRQSEALELSGWGERFTFVQPHNLCFWVYVALTGIGAVHLATSFAPVAGFYGEAVAIAAVLCGLCGLAWWLWFRHIDRWERQPLGLVLAGLLWGALTATLAFAVTANGALLQIWSKLLGQDWANNWAAGLTAPFTEEAAKLCGFLLLLGLAPRLVRTANDGLVIGAFIGLGFAAVEDWTYAVNSTAAAFGTDPVGNAVQVSFLRISASFVSHPLFSALVCSGVVYLIGTAAQPRRIGRGILFVLAGMVLHFAWDDAGGFGNWAIVPLLLSIVGGFWILSVAFRQAAPREHQFVRDILAAEVAAGTVTTDELDGVLDRKARKAFRKAAPSRRARRARKHLRRAILDLTHDVARARGADTETVLRGRQEVARLRATAETTTNV
jgi:protease PrsW